MRMGRTAVGLVLVLAVSAAPLRAQQAAVRATLSGRAQVQWNSTSVDAEEAGASAPIAGSTFEMRRVRLGADVLVADWINGKVEVDFAMGRLQVKQAWAAFELDPALVVRAGQFRKPFSLLELTSSAQVPVIERGVRIRGLEGALRSQAGGEWPALRGDALLGEQNALLGALGYTGDDLGAQVAGRSGGLGWVAGVFNGSGPDRRDENSGKSLVARATYTLPSSRSLTFGAGWSRRELNWPTPASATTRAGNAFGADLELGGFRRGVWLLADAAVGDNLVSDESFAAAQVVASWFRATGGARVEGFEPVARVSWADPDRSQSGDAGLLLTPGINLYFVARNRLMLNWDVYVPESDALSVQHAGRAQINLYF